MLRLRSILHPTDFSPSAEAALAHALRLARLHGAVVHVVHVTPDLRNHHLHDALRALVDEEALYQRHLDEAEHKARALLDAHHATDVPVQWEVLRGLKPASVLLEYGEAQNVDLIVMGTHGLRGIRHLLLGSVAEELVRRASCPVLTVRSRDAAHKIDLPVYRYLLVPVDFSDFARQAVAYAGALAALDDGFVDLLHVVDPVRTPAFYQAGLRRREALAEELEAEALRQLKALWREVHGERDGATFHTRTGYPPDEIVTFADEHPTDLIVLPTHGLRGIERIPMGSVAERVVRNAPCPVFVTKPFGTSLLRDAVSAEPATAKPTATS